MSGTSFPDIARVDAHDKVRGCPIYSADDVRPDMLHAALAVSTVAKGRVTNLDVQVAGADPGCVGADT